MTHHVRRHFARDTRFDCVVFDQSFDGTRRDARSRLALGKPFAVRSKQRIAHIFALFEIIPYRLLRRRGEEHDAHFVALAAHRKFIA